MDIQRHLKNETVIARPASLMYRFQTLVRRHQVVFGAAGAVVLSLVLGLSCSTRSFFREKQAHARADEESRRANAAEKNVREELWNSQLTQARAERWSHRTGRRNENLQLLAKAADYQPSLALRNEAIASLALTDLRVAQRFTNASADNLPTAFDNAFDQ